jgi:hypothetical protein
MGRVKESIAWPNAPDRTIQVNQYLEDRFRKAKPDRICRRLKDKYVLVGDRVEEVKEIIVHEFSMGDVEDPDLYAAEPLHKWEDSEQGQWIMKNAVETPSWYRIADFTSFGYRYQIRAKLMGPALTEWMLRYGK